MFFFFFFQAEDGIRDYKVTGVQTCALPIYSQTAFILDIKAYAEALARRLAPSHYATNPDARQRKQGERDLDRLAGRNFILAAHGHATSADLLAGCGEAAAVARHHGNFGDHRDAHITAELVLHE